MSRIVTSDEQSGSVLDVLQRLFSAVAECGLEPLVAGGEGRCGKTNVLEDVRVLQSQPCQLAFVWKVLSHLARWGRGTADQSRHLPQRHDLHPVELLQSPDPGLDKYAI